MLSSLAAAFGSLFIGGAVAAATIVGVVESQTAPPAQNPVSVNAETSDLITYGSN